MKSAPRVAASSLGAYAGLLAVEHGVFEILQAGGAPDDLIFNAIGAPCEPSTVWHACFPAMTVVPSFLATGILAVTIGLLTAIWSAIFIQRQGGGLVLLFLSIALLLLGGGFVAPFIGIVAAGTATTIGAPLRWWRTRVPEPSLQLLAGLWPSTLILMLVWFPGAWVLGGLVGPTMMRLSGFLFFVFDIGLPLLTPMSAMAHDARKGVPGEDARGQGKAGR